LIGFGVFVLILFLTLYGFGFKKQLQTLKDFSTFAKSKTEQPEPDNKDYIKPDYTTYIKKQSWNLSSLKKTLSKVSNFYQNSGYANDVILKFTPQPDTHFVILGNIHGSLHSLIRDFEELERLGIINNNLEITNPKYYFIFMGNVINLSPFSLETLYLVLNFVNKNPNKTFYLVGEDEN
jgi:hypothetical protein